MNLPSLANAHGPARDPRDAADFRAEFYPSANGKPAPSVATVEPNHRIALEFLTAYYEINRCSARLTEVRAELPSESRSLRERATLQEIEAALLRRDALEDRCAPRGIIAEPVMKEGCAVDVRFTFGNVDSTGQKRNQPRFSSAFITIPLPPGVNAKGPKPPGKR